ncbi:sortase [Candidatus Saccharibacteria bacterium]|nr:sortase [Candidatus Saccharibacteria bacterium]
MGKRLFLLLFISIIGTIYNVQNLTATDSVSVMQPDFNAVETREIKEKTPEITTSNDTNVKAIAVATSAPVQTAVAPAPVYVAPANSITIAGKTHEIVNVSSTTVDSGTHVNKYGEKFLYGHNSGAVFGSLTSVGVGSTFSVNTNGITSNYSVAKVVIYEKNVSAGTLQLNGAGNYMRQVANAKSDGVYYDLSIMTCYGTSYGNGDASHRYVIFANRI